MTLTEIVLIIIEKLMSPTIIIALIGFIIKSLVSNFFSTDVEKALETNYSRGIRNFWNFLTFFAYITFIFISIAVVSIGVENFSKSNNLGTETSDEQKIVTASNNNKKNTEIQSQGKVKENIDSEHSNIEMAILIIIYLYACLLIYRSYVKELAPLYTKRSLITIERKEYTILKRIESDKVLLKFDTCKYRIVTLCELSQYDIHVESDKECENRRYRTIFEGVKQIALAYRKGNKFVAFLSVIMILVFLIIGLDNSPCMLVIILSSILLYVGHEYRKGKKLSKTETGDNYVI